MMTRCIDPNAISEGDLLAYAAGQASPAVRAHLQRCAYCAERAIALRRLDGRLLVGQYRAACPSPSALARWQVQLAPAGEAARIAAHVRSCPHCTRELDELAAVDDELLNVLLENLPPVRGWIEAGLVAPTPERHYRAGSLDIFVHTQVVPAGRQLLGRLLLPVGPAGRVEVFLVQGGQALASSPADESGNFSFTTAAPGPYDMGFAWQDQAVLVRGVEA